MIRNPIVLWDQNSSRRWAKPLLGAGILTPSNPATEGLPVKRNRPCAQGNDCGDEDCPAI